jgi:monoamine oxidase
MNAKVSRRDFLHLAGSLGGSTAVYRAAMALGLMSTARSQHEDRRPISTLTRSRKVLILGAGISGLTAAY